MAIQKVVLIGAGGNLGPSILKGLLDGGFDVTIVARKSSTSKFPAGVNVSSVSDDYPHAELVEAFKGQDAVVATVAGMSTAIQKTMIDAAVETGVQRFIPAEYGSDPPQTLIDMHPLFGVKHEIKHYLQSKENTGLTWTGIVNHAFFEWGIETGFLRFDLKNKKVQLYDGGNNKFRTSTWAAVSAATNGVLKNLEGTKNRIVHVRSFELTPLELLVELEKATGAKWDTENLDGDRFKAENEKKMKEGDFGAAYNLIYACIASSEDFNPETPLDNDILGVPKEDLSEIVSRVVKGQE